MAGAGGGHLGEEQSLWHQAEGQLVTGIVQEVLQPQEGHAAQLPPVPPVDPDLQLPGLHREIRLTGGGPSTSHYPSSLPPHDRRSPRSTQGQPHPLQGDDKGLVPGLLGHRPPACLAHNTIVHLQHGQHLTCKARVGAQGRPGVGGGPLRSPAPRAPYSLASSPPPRCCLALLRSQPWEGLPASAAAGERPGTAVSSCSQPRRRTCSVPVGEHGEGPSSDAILQGVPQTPGMLPSHAGSKPRACSPYTLAATCHPGGRPTGPLLLPSLYEWEEAGTQRQRSQTQTSVLSLPGLRA